MNNVDVDVALVKFLGWSEVEVNDIGDTIGIDPESGRLKHIPSPTTDFTTLKCVISKLNEDGFSLSLTQFNDHTGVVYDASFTNDKDNSLYNYYEHSDPIIAIAGAASAIIGEKPEREVRKAIVPIKIEHDNDIVNSKGLLNIAGDCVPVSCVRRVSSIKKKELNDSIVFTFSLTLSDTSTKAIFTYGDLGAAQHARNEVLNAMVVYQESMGALWDRVTKRM